MSKYRQGFIIDTQGVVILWVTQGNRTADGFYFEVINGSWRGRWADSDGPLTNGSFKVAESGDCLWQLANFRYAPPSLPHFGMAAYNEAITWMQRYIDEGN